MIVENELSGFSFGVDFPIHIGPWHCGNTIINQSIHIKVLPFSRISSQKRTFFDRKNISFFKIKSLVFL